MTFLASLRKKKKSGRVDSANKFLRTECFVGLKNLSADELHVGAKFLYRVLLFGEGEPVQMLVKHHGSVFIIYP